MGSQITKVEQILENELSKTSIWYTHRRDFRSFAVNGKSPAQLYEKQPHETELKYFLKRK